MSVETNETSYNSQDIALLREVVDSAEGRLQAQLTSALAADQRALVLAGFLSAAIVALVGGGVALLLAEPAQIFLALTALVCAAGFIVALSLTIYAARPVAWSYPGTRPGAWIRDIATKKVESERLAELCADLHRKVSDNADLMQSNGQIIRAALLFTLGSLIVGALALAWFLVR
jgi:hypothetical protein